MQSNPITGLERPNGFQEVEVLRFQRQSAHEGGKIVSPMNRPPLPPENIPGTHFYYRLSQPQGHSAAGRIMSMKNSNDTIGNRTRDFPTCSAVPQPTAPPRTFTQKSVSYKNEMAAVLWSGFRYKKHNFRCQPVSMVRHYCLDQTEKKQRLERQEKGENKESTFLKLILKYKETKTWKTGGGKKKCPLAHEIRHRICKKDLFLCFLLSESLPDSKTPAFQHQYTF